jgi:hypothetical protein
MIKTIELKKWLALPLVLMLAFTLVAPVAADDPTPTPTIDPTLNMVVTVNVYAAGEQSASGSIQCSTIEGNLYTYTQAKDSFESGTFYTKGFTCLGDVTIGSSWNNNIQAEQSVANVYISVLYPGTVYYDADVHTGGTWRTASGVYERGSGIVGTGSYVGSMGTAGATLVHGGTALGIPGPFADYSDHPNETYIYAHDTLKAPCMHDLEKVATIVNGSISATNESGVGQTLDVGSQYELIVSGGPWHSSPSDSTNRYAAAVKVDSLDWTSLADYFYSNSAQCSEGDPLDPTKTIIVFTAVSADWAIRVADAAGQFGDNSGGLDYELDRVRIKVDITCASQYLTGNVIGSGSIPATAANGVQVLSKPVRPGSWVQIVTSGGPWQTSTGGAARYDVAVKNPDASWSPLENDSYSACFTTSTNYITAYVQVPTNDGLYLRVNDTGSFTDNSGAMGYTVYAATYSPISPAGCAETYQLGTLIKTVTVPATLSGGVSVGKLSSGDTDVTGTGGGEADLRYYAIETSGLWYNGSTPETWGGIASNDSTTTPPAGGAFENLQTAPGVTCAVPLDPVGHIRVYLPLSLIHNYWLRAQPVGTVANWQGNSGTLTFSIYEAANMQTSGYTPGPMPGATVCDSSFTKGAAGPTATLQGNDESGIHLNDLGTAWVPGRIYAVETTAGPWSNSGVSSYEVAISDNNGASWTNLMAYPSLLCAQSGDGNHLLVFFLAQSGRVYKLRVYDHGGAYADNTGSIGIIRYDHVTTTINPWGSCSGNYTLSQITVANNNIPVGMINSPITIDNIKAGETYAIEINKENFWYPSLAPNIHDYDSEISHDNGNNWEAFGPALTWPTCVIKTNDATDAYAMTYRIYFKAGTGIYQMRRKSSFPLIAVGGSLKYILYSTIPSDTQSPVSPVAPPITPPEWNLLCYEHYLRPSGFFENTNFQIPEINFGSLGTITFPNFIIPIPNIDQWIQYLEWSVRSYLAWCPEDTAALAAIPTTLNMYEPFGTINDIIVAMQTVQDNVNTLQTSGGEGSQDYMPYSIIFNSGGGESNSFQGILPVLGADSPWMGGKLKWGDGSVALGASGGEVAPIGDLPTVDPASGAWDQSYYYYCQGILAPHVGPGTAVGECAALALVKTRPLIWTLLQLFFDAGTLLAFIKYIQHKWIDAAASG